MGQVTPQDPPGTEWWWDLTTLAPRDQSYPLGGKLEAKEPEVEGLVALGDLDAEAEDSLGRLEKWTVLFAAKHGEPWDDDGIRAMALCMAAEELESDRQEVRAKSYPLPPDTPAGTVVGARQKVLWEVKMAKEKATLAIQQGTATTSATEPRWGAGTVDSASQGWGDQVRSLPASAASEAEAPRMKAPASLRGQTTAKPLPQQQLREARSPGQCKPHRSPQAGLRLLRSRPWC